MKYHGGGAATGEGGYQVLPFAPERRIVADSGRMAHSRHVSYGLLEIDVTRPRESMRRHKEQTGETLSFTAFIVACLARAVKAYPSVQAYRSGGNRLVVFDDVDVVTMIETKVDKVALPHVIRAADRKTFREIHDEIRAVQSSPARSAQTNSLMQLGPRAPSFVRDLFYWFMKRDVRRFKAFSGTVVVTSVGMFGRGSGWGLSFLPMHTLGLTIGSIAPKPGVVDGRVEIREHLCLTLAIDHDVVDGAPAARFVGLLIESIESGYGLDDSEAS
ncbi:MAG: 2-oxo acid dehydrogenase subunit E2 [Rudaea sp.]